jgi:hypothetical protein
MDKAANLLPSTIEQAVKGTPVGMLLQVVDKENIEAFLAIELTKLASLVNVDERLNLQGHQIPFIASQLIDAYKNENLADFKICFERGAMGRYDDKLLRLDAAVIGKWMEKYLEEKYQVIERQLMNEKENPYEARRSFKDAAKVSPKRNLLAALEVAKSGEIDPVLQKHLTPDQIDEIKKNASIKGGQPVNNDYLNAYQRYKLFQNTLRQATKEFYGSNMPTELNRYDDEEGYYLHAANEGDAEAIYNAAKEKMKS